MAAFTDDQMDCGRFDVFAIISNSGLVAIEESLRTECLAWLRQQGYCIEQFDCSHGMEALIPALGAYFRWEEQFGYRMQDGRRRLDALSDGFEFNVPASGGVVFELFRADIVWREDSRWLLGLLQIAMEHSRFHLACGRRFFTLLVLPEKTPLIGEKVDELLVPHPYRNFNGKAFKL